MVQAVEKRLDHLLGGPPRCRVRRNAKAQHPPPFMRENH